MATTMVSIPLTKITHAVSVGPASVADAISQIDLVINRNVGANPIDLAPSSEVLTIAVQASYDGGATWLDQVTATINGGKIIPTRGPNAGVEQTTSGVGVNLDPGTGRRVRATVTPAQTLTVSGSLTAS